MPGVKLFGSRTVQFGVGEGGWTTPDNILDIDADVAAITNTPEAPIPQLRLEDFNPRDSIPEGAKIIRAKVVYVARTVAPREGNPITGVLVAALGEYATAGPWEDVEGEGVSTEFLETSYDLTAFGWDIIKLDDLTIDVRCRNNAEPEKESPFEFQVAYLEVGYELPTPGEWFLSHEDEINEADPSDDWGNWGLDATPEAVVKGRFAVAEEGDARPKADGSASLAKCRILTIKNGDKPPGDGEGQERIEMGRNERRYGQDGAPGTFILYPDEVRRRSWFSVYFDPLYPIATDDWQLFMQMKSAQPYDKMGKDEDESISPILTLEAHQNQFQLHAHNLSKGFFGDDLIWTAPATVGTWIRFAIDVFYSNVSGKGWVRVYLDDRKAVSDWVPQYDSGRLYTSDGTLYSAIGDQEGVNWSLKDGEAIDSHLRLGTYRNSKIEEETYTKFSNVQVETFTPAPPAVQHEFPPDRIATRIEIAGSTAARWAEDEPGAENILADVVLEDEIPGGCKSYKGTLARDPQLDWSDIEEYAEMVVYQPGVDPVWEGFLDKGAGRSGKRRSMAPGGLGWQAVFNDDGAVKIGFIDGDLTKWTEPSTQRRLNVLQLSGGNGRYAYSPEVHIGFKDAGQEAPGLIFTLGALVDGLTEIQELFYYGDEIDIGSIKYDFKEMNGMGKDTAFQDLISLFSDDVGTLRDNGFNHEQVTALNQTLWASVTGRKYARAKMEYNGTAAGSNFANAHGWLNLKVLGNHGLASQGTWPDIGFFAQQMLLHTVNNYASPLKATEESVESDDFIIPQAWYSGRTLASIIDDIVKYALYDWFIYHGKLFEHRQPGTYGKFWKTNVASSELNELGIDSQRLWHSIVVQFAANDGSIRTVGPPGSNSNVETSALEITDPDHPAVKANRTRRDRLDLRGIGSPEISIKVGERFLEQANLLNHSGSATISGYIPDDKGIFWPVGQMKSGDWISFGDAHDPSYRKIVHKTYNHRNRSAEIDIDAPPSGLDALLERLQVGLISLGVA